MLNFLYFCHVKDVNFTGYKYINYMKDKQKKSEIKNKEVHLTSEILEKIAEKTGYSVSTVEQVLRGRVAPNQRHKIIFDLYEKIDYLRSLHRENYMKDLSEI